MRRMNRTAITQPSRLQAGVRPRHARMPGEPPSVAAKRHTPQDHIEAGMAKHGNPSIAEPQSADSQHVANRGWAQEPTERPLHAVLNKWCHGRAFIEVEPGGFFHVENRKIIDGVLR